MGQMTFGIMYRVAAEYPDDGAGDVDDVGGRINEAAWQFERGDVEWDGGHIGLWVAVGGSGKPDAGDLWTLNGCETTPEGVRRAFPEDVAACEAAWPAFVEHMKAAGGIELAGEPKLWLVQTETA